jgi:hypothetical protein
MFQYITTVATGGESLYVTCPNNTKRAIEYVIFLSNFYSTFTGAYAFR